jgi:hypothetical protein
MEGSRTVPDLISFYPQIRPGSLLRIQLKTWLKKTGQIKAQRRTRF